MTAEKQQKRQPQPTTLSTKRAWQHRRSDAAALFNAYVHIWTSLWCGFHFFLQVLFPLRDNYDFDWYGKEGVRTVELRSRTNHEKKIIIINDYYYYYYHYNGCWIWHWMDLYAITRLYNNFLQASIAATLTDDSVISMRIMILAEAGSGQVGKRMWKEIRAYFLRTIFTEKKKNDDNRKQ